MDLLEYQGKQLFARHGVPVPSGSPATTVEEAVAAADEIGYPCVVKAQVQIGGRGKAGGIKVTTVEIRDVGIPSAMQRAMAKQAEAERERRAKVIKAEAEAQAATRLAEAADVISRNPATLQLRYMQTLTEIGVEKNSTVVFPLPMDLIKPLMEAAQAQLPKGAGETPRFTRREAERVG